jgi:hypothetical protein
MMILYLIEWHKECRFLLEEADHLGTGSHLGSILCLFAILTTSLGFQSSLRVRPGLHESCGFPKAFTAEAGLKDAFWRGVVIAE